MHRIRHLQPVAAPASNKTHACSRFVDTMLASQSTSDRSGHSSALQAPGGIGSSARDPAFRIQLSYLPFQCFSLSADVRWRDVTSERDTSGKWIVKVHPCLPDDPLPSLGSTHDSPFQTMQRRPSRPLTAPCQIDAHRTLRPAGNHHRLAL